MIARIAYLSTPAPGVYVLNIQPEGEAMDSAPRDGSRIKLKMDGKEVLARYQPGPDQRGVPGPHGRYVWKVGKRGGLETWLAERAPSGWARCGK